MNADVLEGADAFKLERLCAKKACQGSTLLENGSPKIISANSTRKSFSDPPIFCGAFLLDTFGSRVSKNSLDSGSLFREGHPTLYQLPGL